MKVLELTVRKMTVEDIGQVQQVANISWNYTYEGIIPTPIQQNFLNIAYSVVMMQKRLEQSLMLVAHFNDEIIGFANYSPVNELGQVELAAIYLLPDYHGQGIGTILLNEGITALPSVKQIFINVEKDNKIGMSFYKAKGFEVVSEFDEDFEGYALKTVRMVLKI